jgi:DNA-binding MarR family transcriptional regulator
MGPESLPLEDLDSELLYFAYRSLIQTTEEILGQEGLGRLEWRILRILSVCPGVATSFLSDRTGTSRQYIHLALRKLVEGGWVDKETSVRDPRANSLHLSFKGEKFLSKVLAPLEGRLSSARRVCGEEAYRAWLAFNRELLAKAAENEDAK